MEDRDEPQSSAADIIGFIGLALAVFGLADMALLYRLACLAGASICLPVSFHRQSGWPAWVRWMLSVLTNFFLAYVAWGVIGAR